MDKKEALKIIEKEKLKGYNFSGNNIKANEVGVQSEDNLWKVYSTDEKADLRVIKEYIKEKDAIEHVIECLRVNKRLEERFNRRSY